MIYFKHITGKEYEVQLRRDKYVDVLEVKEKATKEMSYIIVRKFPGGWFR